MKEYKWATLGCGVIANQLAQAFAANGRKLYSVANRTHEKAVAFAEKYGMNKEVVYPHSFRHRFAKNFLDRFNDLALLADLMGHESIETTRIYLRRTASEQQKIVDRVVNW